MVCPQCHRRGRLRPIALGWAECLTVITYDVDIPQPPAMVIHPGLGYPVPIPVPPARETRQRICRMRQYVPMAVELPRCECGLFAVGLCHRCQVAVCGEDHQRVANRVLCRTCATEEAKKQQEASRQARAATAASAPPRPVEPPAEAPLPYGTALCDDSSHFRRAPNGSCFDCRPFVRVAR